MIRSWILTRFSDADPDRAVREGLALMLPVCKKSCGVAYCTTLGQSVLEPIQFLEFNIAEALGLFLSVFDNFDGLCLYMRVSL